VHDAIPRLSRCAAEERQHCDRHVAEVGVAIEEFAVHHIVERLKKRKEWGVGGEPAKTNFEKESEAVLGVWLPAPLPTSRAPPGRGALWPLA